MKFVSFLTCCVAAILAAVPAFAAADSGGVLPWTQWALGCAGAVSLVFAIIVCVATGGRVSLNTHSLVAVLLLISLFSVLQLVPLPSSILASGSATAYAEAVEIIAFVPNDKAAMNSSGHLGTHPISIAPWLTKETAALMSIITAYVAIGSMVFVTRSTVTILLIGISFTGAIQAGFGIYQILADPSATVWGIKSIYGGAPFGSFVNRSSAAVLMNFGMAASVGLIAWRLAAMSGATIDGDEFPFRELLDVIFDRIAMVAIVCALLCASGLLACGSRGGLVGALAGFLMAFGIVQSLHKGKGLIPAFFFVGLMAAILLLKFELPATSIERLQKTPDSSILETGLQDGRWDHWKDGWQAGMAQPLVGWGAGCYRYAYLPFQQFSGGAWFVNADNLWLEWFVEMGLIGVVLAAVAAAIFIKALRNLNSSPDPIDHGLATAGWFALGAILVSQFFDFGVRIPANSIVGALMVGGVVGRCSVIGFFVDVRQRKSDRSAPNRESDPHDSFIKNNKRPFFTGLIMLLLCALFLLPSISHLSAEANADHLRRLARILPRGPQFNPIIAQEIELGLQSHVATHPDDFNSQLQLSKLTVDSARYKAARDAMQDPNNSDWVASYRKLAPLVLRSIWYQSAGEEAASPLNSIESGETTGKRSSAEPLFPISDSKDESIASLLDTVQATDIVLQERRVEFGAKLASARFRALEALLYCPLSAETHATLAGLDFAGGSAEQSARLLSRMIVLRSRNSRSLLLAGQLASEGYLWDVAKRAWQTAMRLDPGITLAVLQSINENGPLSASDLLPESPDAVSIVVDRELIKTSPDRAMLGRAAEILQRELPADRVMRANRLMLIAKIYSKREQPAIAAENLAKVVAIQPSNLEARYQYAVSLRAAGNLPEARQQARAGRKIAPKDLRFEQLLTAMSE